MKSGRQPIVENRLSNAELIKSANLFTTKLIEGEAPKKAEALFGRGPVSPASGPLLSLTLAAWKAPDIYRDASNGPNSGHLDKWDRIFWPSENLPLSQEVFLLTRFTIVSWSQSQFPSPDNPFWPHSLLPSERDRILRATLVLFYFCSRRMRSGSSLRNGIAAAVKYTGFPVRYRMRFKREMISAIAELRQHLLKPKRKPRPSTEKPDI